MPRLMSFAATVEQVRNRTKTVTRRNGWTFLRVGDILTAVDRNPRCGDDYERLCDIRVTDIRTERLTDITVEDVAKEGFPGKSPAWFMAMYRKAFAQWRRGMAVRRIKFEYIGPATPGPEERLSDVRGP